MTPLYFKDSHFFLSLPREVMLLTHPWELDLDLKLRPFHTRPPEQKLFNLLFFFRDSYYKLLKAEIY